MGKPLHYLKNTFIIKIGNKRLVYSIENDRIISLFFKSRNGVYDYLR